MDTEVPTTVKIGPRIEVVLLFFLCVCAASSHPLLYFPLGGGVSRVGRRSRLVPLIRRVHTYRAPVEGKKRMDTCMDTLTILRLYLN